jgi:hexosaminidase
MSAIRNAPRSGARLAGALGIALALSVALSAPASGKKAPQNMAPAPQIVPKPVSTTVGHGQFSLTERTRVVATGGATALADDLVGYLRPATGYRLPVVSGRAHHGDIALRLGNPGTLGADRLHEGYQLDVTSKQVTLTAKTAHGLFNGVQTIRQLLPPWISSRTERSGPWTMPAVHITDYPRYGYRGLMLDIARHFETPSAVKKLIDQASAYKVNTFHLHLSDDQGFRIVIKGFPNLTAIGGRGAVGTDGRTMDPGGFWTQAQYKDVVAYAAAHFMTVVPEVDSPGHTNAIIMSEYNDTANPRLNGHPQDINCSVNNPPVWNYTGDVGYSALCPESDNTYSILTAIIDQLTALSSSRYYNLGGDEVPRTVLSRERYAALVNTEAGIVHSRGKTVMGWAEIAGADTNLPAGSVAEYWNPASGSDEGTETGTEAVAKHMKIVMAPANHAYLDQKYTATVPANLGLTWACNTGCDVDQFYNWEPSSYVDGVTDANVIGVEGAIWAETLRNLNEVDYMAFPRLPALAELGWSPKVTRTASSPAYQDFLTRLAAQGPRFLAGGVNFYPTPEVPWRLDLTAAHPRIDQHGRVGATLATLSAPGFATSELTATIDWGDGTNSPGVLSGRPATNSSVNGLYAIRGQHTYQHGGGHHVTITVTAPNTAPATLRTTLGD